jgi:hypothetical protein
MNNIVRRIMLLGCITSNMMYSHTSITDRIKEHFPAARQAIIDIANLYVRCFISTLGHELGHAIAAKLICGQSTRIVLGTAIDTKSTLPISVGGFIPVIGGCHGFKWNDDNLICNLLCIAAGPIGGILTTYFVNKFTDHSPYAIKTPFLKSCKNFYYGLELFRMIPMKNRSEGYIILDLLRKIAVSK